MILEEAKVLIKTEKLCKSGRLGNKPEDVLRNVNIRLMRGEFAIIKGISGSKKNLFFNLIGCIEKPSSGKYYFDYEDIALSGTDTLDSIRKYKIGYLFRNFNLVADMTAIKNIEMPMYGSNIPRQEKKDRLENALRRFDIEAIAEEKVSSLSDFQKQMVSLARAVINKPLLIIADEPAANLDSGEEQKLMEHLVWLNKEGTAIMLITEKEEYGALESCMTISVEAGRTAGGAE